MADLPDDLRRLREEALILSQALADRRAEDPLLTFQPFPKQQAFITSVLRNLKQENWLVTANRFGKSDAGAFCGAALARFGGEPRPAYSEGGDVEVWDRATSGWVSSLDANMSRDIVEPKYFDNGHTAGMSHAPFIPRREIVEPFEGVGWRVSEKILKLKNGSLIGFKGAESGRAKYMGAEKDWIHLDEEHPKDIYTEILIRVGPQPIRIFCTATLLPPQGQVGGVTWVFPDIIQKWQAGELPHVEVFGGSIYDNPHIPRSEIARLESAYPEGSTERAIRLEGKWLPGLSGARAYPRFDRRLHVRAQPKPQERKPLCWIWDFNVEPMVSLVGQRDGVLFRVFKELTLDEGDILEMCNYFVQEFPRHFGEIWVYGDATGRARSAQTGQSCYSLIQNAMRAYGAPLRLKVPNENPFVPDRINSVQRAFKDEHGSSRIEMDPGCKELIADLEQVLRDPRGGIKKTHDRQDPYYRRTHWSDAFGYWIVYDEPVRLARLATQRPLTIPVPGYTYTAKG